MIEAGKVDEIVERWRFVDTHSPEVSLSIEGSSSPGVTLNALLGARDDIARLANAYYVLAAKIEILRERVAELEGELEGESAY